MTTTKAAPPPVPRAAWAVSAVVVLGAFLTQLDSALVNIGLATVARDLSADLATTQWTVSGYLLGLVVALPACGWLCRRLGAGRVWLAALAAFTVVSALCATSSGIGWLVAWRCLQGLAGGLLLPAGQTVIAQVAGRAAMGRVMSVVGSALVLAPALGPVLGSWVLTHLSWPWLFLVNVPVGLLALGLGARLLPRGDRGRPPTFDGRGFVLLATALPLLTYAIGAAGDGGGPGAVGWWVVTAGGLVLLATFVGRGRGVAPGAGVLDLTLFGVRPFRCAAVVSALVGVVQFGVLVLWPLRLQLVDGYSLVGSGAVMVAFAVGSAFLLVSGRLTDRFGGGPVCVAGTALMLVALVVPALGTDGRVGTLVALGLLGVGSAMSVVPASTAAYVAIDPSRIPDAVTVVNILLRVGGAVGAAAMVAVVGGTSLGAVDPDRFRAAFWVAAGVAAIACAAAARLTLATRSRPVTTAPATAPPAPSATAPLATAGTGPRGAGA